MTERESELLRGFARMVGPTIVEADDLRAIRAAIRERIAALDACQATINRLEMHVNNPSAWEHYDQSVSDLIAETVKECRAAVAKAKGGAA